MTNTTEEELTDKIVRDLTLDPANLSSRKRKLTSAPDQRATSMYAGTVSVAIVTVIVVAIVAGDAFAAAAALVNWVKNIKNAEIILG